MADPRSKPSRPAEAEELGIDQTTMLFRPKSEEEWESRRNSFLEAHPYLVGYAFLTIPVVLVFATKLTTFAVAFLFLFLVSDFLTHDLGRHLPSVPKGVMFSLLYVVVTALAGLVAFKLVPDLARALPSIADEVKDRAIAAYQDVNERWGLSQYVTTDDVVGQITEGIKFAHTMLPSVTGAVSRISSYVVFFVFALVLNVLLYHDQKSIEAVFTRRPESLLGFLYRFSSVRVRLFYYYFKRVMGGQLVIATINTGISALVILGLGLPQRVALLLTVFVCGLLPIVGNLISNSIVTLVALASIGVWGALVCVGVLVGVHKLEYFLNSKIIGDIVKLPMAVILASLVVCEVVLGFVGLILAVPLTLFVRHELEHVPGLPASHPAEPSRLPAPAPSSAPKQSARSVARGG